MKRILAHRTSRKLALAFAFALLLSLAAPFSAAPETAKALGSPIRSGSLGKLGSPGYLDGSEVGSQSSNGDHFMKSLTDPNVVIVGDGYDVGGSGKFWHFVNGDGKSVTLTFAPSRDRNDPNRITVEVNAMSTANPAGKHYGVITPPGWYLVDAAWTGATGGNFTLSHMEPFRIGESTSGGGGGNVLPVLPPARISAQKRVASPSSMVANTGVYVIVLTPVPPTGGSPVVLTLSRNNGWTISNRYIRAGTYSVTERTVGGAAIVDFSFNLTVSSPGDAPNPPGNPYAQSTPVSGGVSGAVITIGLRSSVSLTVTNTNPNTDTPDTPSGPGDPGDPGGPTPPPVLSADSGYLSISKEFPSWDCHAEWGIDFRTEFTARLSIPVLRVSSGDSYVYVLDDEPGAANYEVKFTEGSPATIMGIHAGTVVTVTEVAPFPGAAGLVSATYPGGSSATIREGEYEYVTVLNTYDHATGTLEVVKAVSGVSVAALNRAAVEITIWDEDEDGSNYPVSDACASEGRAKLIFSSTPESDGSYRCVGHIDPDRVHYSETGFDGTNTISALQLSTDGTPLRLSNLWVQREYSVVEANPPAVSGYTCSVSSNTIVLSLNAGTDRTITLTNAYSANSTGGQPEPTASPSPTPTSTPTPTPDPDPDPTPTPDPDPTPTPTPDPDDKDDDDGDDGDKDDDEGGYGGGGEDEDDGDGGRDRDRGNRPNVVFPDGQGPANFPQIDFERSQPDRTRPGGNIREAPPIPNVQGNTLVPQYNEDDEVIFIELDEEGVPLGQWGWDDEEELWLFDEFPPLGGWETTSMTLPQTGTTSYVSVYLLLFGLSFVGMGVVFLAEGPDKEKHAKSRK